MPTAASDVVRSYYRTFEFGAVDAAAELWHPDIEWQAMEGPAAHGGLIRGQDALRRYYQDWIDTLADLRADVEEVVFEDGDRVAVAVRNSGRGRTSGAAAEGRYYVACIVRDGRIVAAREYPTRDQALEGVRRLP
jgi:ketosteroid isomerase-like protein